MLERKTDDCTAQHWIYLCKKNSGFETAESNWKNVKLEIFEEEGLGSDFEDNLSPKGSEIN